MIACITPNEWFFEENLSTVNYAAKASKIANQPWKNEAKSKLIIEMLKKENKILTIELWKANEYINSLCTVKGISDVPVFGGEEFKKYALESQGDDSLPPLSGTSPNRKRSP